MNTPHEDTVAGRDAVSPRMTNRNAFAIRVAGYRRHLPVLILFIILSISSILYFVLLAPERFGVSHDDSIYATTAKALANGQGYRIISLPSEPSQTKYPPFYPLLLSLIWSAYPQFPQNISWMIILSVVATLSFLALTYRYLTERDYATSWQALLVVGLAAINWRTMILATSLYSEMVYSALSVAALYLAEKEPSQSRDWVRSGFIGIVIGLAFLTRSSGLTLLMAVGLFYALSRRWSRALIVVSVGGLFVLGWISWCYVNKSDEGVNAAYYANYFRDISGIIRGLEIESGASTIQTIFTILQENFFSAIVVSIPIVCSGLSYATIPGLGAYGGAVSACAIVLFLILILFGFLRHCKRAFGLLHIYFILYLLLFLPIPYISYDRYLIPLLPFLLLFLVTELATATALAMSDSRKRSQRLSIAFLVSIVTATVCTGLYGYGSGIRTSLTSLKTVRANAAAEHESMEWIKDNTDPSAVLACYRDPTYYLYTKRKAVPLTIVKLRNSQQPDPLLLLGPISRSRANYLIVTANDFDHDYETEFQQAALRTLLQQYTSIFLQVFESSDGHTSIYRIDHTGLMLSRLAP